MITKVITREYAELIEENKKLKETIEKQEETINHLIEKYVIDENEKKLYLSDLY